jgi:hypothetical protein
MSAEHVVVTFPSPSPEPKATDVLRGFWTETAGTEVKAEPRAATATERRCPVCQMNQPVLDETGLFLAHVGRFDKLCSYSDREWEDPVEIAEARERAARKARRKLDEEEQQAAHRELVVMKASDIQMKRVKWLWHHRVPLGGLTLIGGRESSGKSSVAYERAARITRGQLVGDLYGKPMGVVIVATEDAWAYTIAPRLVAAGADLDRVYRVGVRSADVGSCEVSLPDDVDALERMVVELGVALVILDPLMSRIGRRRDGRDLDTHKDSEVRMALEPVTALGERTGATVLGIIQNKTATSDPLTALMGSRAFAAVARAVLFVVREEQGRLLCFPKSNLGPEQPSIRFRVETKTVGKDPDDGGAIETAEVVWGEEDSRSARDVLEEQAKARRPRSIRDKAVEWLEKRLSAGSVPSKVLVDEAEKLGISRTALARARKELGNVVVEVSGFPPVSVWSLPFGDL